MGPRIAPAALAAASALWSTSAWAHTSGLAQVLPAPLANPSTGGSSVGSEAWIVAALAAVPLLAGAMCRRKTLGVALIVLTLWMGFEAGAHTVHHLGQPSEESRCAIAAVTAHGTAIPSEVQACVGIVVGQARIAIGADPAVKGRGIRPTHEGRAPPHLASSPLWS